MKQGRPKNIGSKKGRMHTILLTEEGESILRSVTKTRRFNMSQYVDQHLKRDFVIHQEDFLKSQLAQVNQEIINLQGKASQIAKLYSEVQEIKINEADKKRMEAEQ